MAMTHVGRDLGLSCVILPGVSTQGAEVACGKFFDWLPPDRTVFIFTVAVKDASDWPSRMSLCALRKEDLNARVVRADGDCCVVFYEEIVVRVSCWCKTAKRGWHSRSELPTTTETTFLTNSIVISSPLASSTAMYSRQQTRHVQPLSSAYRDIRRDATVLQCKAAPRASTWPFRDQCPSNTKVLARQGALASTRRPLGIRTCRDVSLAFKPSADTYDLLR